MHRQFKTLPSHKKFAPPENFLLYKPNVVEHQHSQKDKLNTCWNSVHKNHRWEGFIWLGSNVPSNFLKSLCAKDFLCAKFCSIHLNIERNVWNMSKNIS